MTLVKLLSVGALLIIGCRQEVQDPVSTPRYPAIKKAAATPLPARGSVTLSNFRVNTIQYQGESWPELAFQVGGGVDFVEWEACRIDKAAEQCPGGVIDFSSQVIANLAAGVYEVRVRPCLHFVENKSLKSECQSWQKHTYIQAESVNKRLNQLLAERATKAQSVRNLGPQVYRTVLTDVEARSNCPDPRIKTLLPAHSLNQLLAMGPDSLGIGLLDPKASLVVDDGGQEILAAGLPGVGGAVTVKESDAAAPPAYQKDGDEPFAKLSFVSAGLAFLSGAALKALAKKAAKKTKSLGENMLKKINPFAAPQPGELPSKAQRWLKPAAIGFGVVAVIGAVVYLYQNRESELLDIGKEYGKDLLSLAEAPCAVALKSFETLIATNQEALKLRNELTLVEGEITALTGKL